MPKEKKEKTKKEKTTDEKKDEGTEVQDKNKDLVQAVKEQNLDKIKLLLDDGANAAFEQYDPGVWGASHRESAIHAALTANNRKPNVEIVKMLLEKGANINAVYEDYDWRGCGSKQTAFEMALDIALSSVDREEEEEEEDGDEEKEEKEEKEKLPKDKSGGYAVLLELVLKYGGNPNAECVSDAHTMRYDGRESWNPIHTAVKRKNTKCLEILINAGANVNAVSKNRGQSEYGSSHDDEETPLLIASSFGYEDGVKLLIRSGAEVNAICKHIENVHVEVQSPTRDPRDYSYIPNVKNVRIKQTPLHAAVKSGHVAVVTILIASGADLSIPYEYGDEKKTVFKIAKDKETEHALTYGWSPKIHPFYPNSIKAVVKTLLLCKVRNQWNIPKDVMLLILKYSVATCILSIQASSSKKGKAISTKEKERIETKRYC